MSDGTISAKSDASKSVTYAELVGGKRFDVALTGRNVDATTGTAAVKPVQELRVVGQPVPRYDIPAKVDGSLTWAVDMKVPGMLHARNVRPPIAGATLRSIDESSVASLPGFVRVVRSGNYVAVVCEREEQAIAAARQLKAEWAPPAQAPFPASAELFDYIRRATPTSSEEPSVTGEPDAAFASAARVIEAEYEVPFQGHTAIGPAHALADPSDGQLTIYSNDMKSYGLRNGVAQFLSLPRDTRARRVHGRAAGLRPHGRGRRRLRSRVSRARARPSGSRPMDAARGDGLGYERPGLRLQAPRWARRAGQADRSRVRRACRRLQPSWVQRADTVLIAQLMGRRRETPSAGNAETPSIQYGIPNQRLAAHVVALPMIWETPLRTGNLRDPNGPQVTFAFEGFIDELAAAAGADPAQFRLDLHRSQRRGQRLPQSALARRRPRGARQVRLGYAAVAEAAQHGARS